MDGDPSCDPRPTRWAWQIIRELLLTFLTGFLLFIALALLKESQAPKAAPEAPASTVYGAF